MEKKIEIKMSGKEFDKILVALSASLITLDYPKMDAESVQDRKEQLRDAVRTLFNCFHGIN